MPLGCSLVGSSNRGVSKEAGVPDVENDQNESLLAFFKALADANRLKIVGLLAQEPRTVEQLAALLSVESPTVSHHLRRLSKAGLVEAQAQGYYSVYMLKTEVLQSMAERLLGGDQLPQLADGVDATAYDRKVLQTFLNEDGSVKAFPAQEKKYLVVVRHLLEAFEHGREYSELEVNEILGHYHEDTARVRRSLIDFGYMQRVAGGASYWRSPSK
jgi:predicted transcriptional regulator